MAFDKQAAIDMAKRLPTFKQDFTLDHYQDIIAATDFPDPVKGPTDPKDERYPLWYYGLALAGESGEAADKIKKIYRNDSGVLTGDNTLGVAYELGDALWYLTRIAAKIGMTLSDVVTLNIMKLSGRAERGTLRTSGDYR